MVVSTQVGRRERPYDESRHAAVRVDAVPECETPGHAPCVQLHVGEHGPHWVVIIRKLPRRALMNDDAVRQLVCVVGVGRAQILVLSIFFLYPFL